MSHSHHVHTCELLKRSERERSNTKGDLSEIDLNECEHFLKQNRDGYDIDPGWIDIIIQYQWPLSCLTDTVLVFLSLVYTSEISIYKQQKQSMNSPPSLGKTKQRELFFFVSPFLLLLAYAWTMIL